MDTKVFPININYYSKNNNLRNVKTDNAVESKPELKKEKSGLTSKTAFLAISTVCLLLMFSKGVQKSTGSFLYKLKKHVEKKKENLLLNGSNKRAKLYEMLMNGTDTFIKKADSINNITSLKDILCMKLMYASNITKKIHVGITQYFEDLSRKTVKESYKKTAKQFETMFNAFESLDNFILENSKDEMVLYNGKMYTKADLVKRAKQTRNTIKDVVDAFISEDAQQKRYENIKTATSDLYSRFWDVSFKDFWTKNNKFTRKEMWQTFIAAEQVKYDKAALTTTTSIVRNAISYLSEDKKNIILDSVNSLEKMIPKNDTEAVESLKRLKWYALNPEVISENKDVVFKELEIIKKSSTNVDSKIAAIQNNNKLAYVDMIEYALDDAKSEMKEITDIYYKIAPEQFLKSGAFLSMKKAVNAFDKSLYLETAEFFDKERDLVLGSAFTDVLTILLSFITISCGLGYAKDADERISIVIKSGIPILGAIATAVIAATKLVSGGKSLAMGMLSGVALNQAGNIIDTYRKLKNKSYQL